MNAKPTKNLPGYAPGSPPIVATSSLLRWIFDTPAKKRRLRRVLGCSMGEVYKKLRGDRSNPLKLAFDVFVLALAVDCARASFIADLFLDTYHAHIGTGSDAERWDNHDDANRLSLSACRAFCALNAADMTLHHLLAAQVEVADVRHHAARIGAVINARIRVLNQKEEVVEIPVLRSLASSAHSSPRAAVR